MPFLSEKRRGEIFEHLSQTIDLASILNLLEEEIDKLHQVDGFIINLCDGNTDDLVSVKVRFTPEFQFLNETYIGYKISLHSEYVNARAFRERRRLSCDLDNASEHERKLLATWRLNQMAALPLVDPNDALAPALGTILLLNCSGTIPEAAFSAVDELITLFYRPLFNALDHAKYKNAYDRAKEVTAEHDRFLQFIVEINNLTSPNKIYELFKQELFRQFDFDSVSFFMLHEDRLVGEYLAVARPEFDGAKSAWYEFMRQTSYSAVTSSDGGVSHVFTADSSLLFRDVQQILSLPMSDNDRRMLEIMCPMRTLLMVPMRYQNQAIGVINLCSLTQQLDISDADISLLNYLGSFLGTAITNSRHYTISQEQNREIERLNLILQDRVEELSHQVSVDRLTGLYNFRTFQQELARRVSESKRSMDSLGLSIAVVDIDHFKRFNDTYGHSAGNDVLAAVAREIAQLARKDDLACRYGGEEFVIILPQCDPEGVQQFAERVRIAVENRSVMTVAGLLSVTVSVGCTSYVHGESEEELFHRADQALYLAKKGGRNRVEML